MYCALPSSASSSGISLSVFTRARLLVEPEVLRQVLEHVLAILRARSESRSRCRRGRPHPGCTLSCSARFLPIILSRPNFQPCALRGFVGKKFSPWHPMQSVLEDDACPGRAGRSRHSWRRSSPSSEAGRRSMPSPLTEATEVGYWFGSLASCIATLSGRIGAGFHDNRLRIRFEAARLGDELVVARHDGDRLERAAPGCRPCTCMCRSCPCCAGRPAPP